MTPISLDQYRRNLGMTYGEFEIALKLWGTEHLFNTITK